VPLGEDGRSVRRRDDDGVIARRRFAKKFMAAIVDSSTRTREKPRCNPTVL